MAKRKHNNEDANLLGFNADFFKAGRKHCRAIKPSDTLSLKLISGEPRTVQAE